MSTRTSSALALSLLAACGRAPVDRASPETTAGAGDHRIGCALAGSAGFTHACEVERVRDGKGLVLVVRHPDGGFRRFDVLGDGHGLATADGAQAAEIAVGDGQIEVAVGRDRYRFPATVADVGR
jgi:hypothetical protein